MNKNTISNNDLLRGHWRNELHGGWTHSNVLLLKHKRRELPD